MLESNKLNDVDLTISIISYNTKDLLRACLESVYENISRIRFEVIVVDNGSLDGSKEMIKDQFPEVILIENKNNAGFAGANNQAFSRSKGRFFLLLNSDTKLPVGTISAMTGFMELHSQVGIVGCQQIRPDGSIQPTINFSLNMWTNLWLIFLSLFQWKKLILNARARSFVTRYLGWALGKTVGSYLHHYSPSKMPYEVDWVPGVCLLARREAIDQVGLLDENFFMYDEDVDWCLRMKQKGWKVYFLPGNKVVHYVTQSSERIFDGVSPLRYKSAFYFFAKYYGEKGVVLLRILVIVSILIQEGFFLLLYLSSDRREEFRKKSRLGWDLVKFSLSFDNLTHK